MLFRRMADGLDVVSVGITDEGAVIARVILRPHPRFMQHMGARGDRRVEERPYCSAIGRSERDVSLTEPRTARPWADPEVGLRRDTEADDLSELPQPPPTERGKDDVVERGARSDVSALN